jgi:hypothetical protein
MFFPAQQAGYRKEDQNQRKRLSYFGKRKRPFINEQINT